MAFRAHRIRHRAWGIILGMALGGLVAAQPLWATQQQPQTTPVAWVAPPGVVRISECVPLMGEHWARPADLPMGPIYTVDGGRLTSIEYMPAQADFAAGRSWEDLTLQYGGQPLIFNHVDVTFLAQGHEGYEVPHYDLHFYLVSPAEKRAITCRQ